MFVSDPPASDEVRAFSDAARERRRRDALSDAVTHGRAVAIDGAPA